jgi:glycosyltransferase involved in cell wall biosynthesis
MKPRVLMLTHQCAGRGGSFMRAVSLARPLGEMGYDMTLIASRAAAGISSVRSNWHGVDVLELPDFFPHRIRNGGLSPLDLSARLVHVWLSHYDLFHTFDHRPCASLPALWRAHRQIPVVSDWADLWGRDGLAGQRTDFVNRFLTPFDDALESHVRKQSDAVTVISSDLKKRAMRLGVSEERIRTVPAGANPDIIHPLEKAEVRLKYEIPSDRPVLVYSGFSSLDAELLGATFLLLSKMVPNVMLLVTGSSMPVFDQFMESHPFHQNVRYFGVLPYDQLGEILSCGDVMLLPYSNTSVNVARFPNRFGEYIAAGRPIATNRIGDHAEIVEREGVGIVTSPVPESFAEGIASLLVNPKRLEEMGSRARKLATSSFSWKQIAVTVAELYAELLS